MRMHILLLSMLIFSGCVSPVSVKDPNNITTKEMVSILKHESIERVSTTHSNHVSITLNDGRTFEGVYNPADIPKLYANPSLHPASSFVDYMRKKRLFSTWDLECE